MATWPERSGTSPPTTPSPQNSIRAFVPRYRSCWPLGAGGSHHSTNNVIIHINGAQGFPMTLNDDNAIIIIAGVLLMAHHALHPAGKVQSPQCNFCNLPAIESKPNGSPGSPAAWANQPDFSSMTL